MEEFIRFFWIFMLGGFFGFLIETIWCMIRLKKIESRKGLIYGHFIPIYAFAALFISAVVEVFKIRKWYMVFLITFFISGVVEYVSSVFQEKCMGTSSWNYSNMKYNLNGRINLVYLVLFGLVGIIWCKGYPSILKFIFRLMRSKEIIYIVTMGLLIFMIINIIISCMAGSRQKRRRKGIKAKNRLEIWIDNKYTDEYMAKIYPNASFVDEAK